MKVFEIGFDKINKVEDVCVINPLYLPLDSQKPLHSKSQNGVHRAGQGDLSQGQHQGDKVGEHLGINFLLHFRLLKNVADLMSVGLIQ